MKIKKIVIKNDMSRFSCKEENYQNYFCKGTVAIKLHFRVWPSFNDKTPYNGQWKKNVVNL